MRWAIVCAYLYVKQPILNNVETDNAQTDMPKWASDLFCCVKRTEQCRIRFRLTQKTPQYQIRVPEYLLILREDDECFQAINSCNYRLWCLVGLSADQIHYHIIFLPSNVCCHYMPSTNLSEIIQLTISDRLSLVQSITLHTRLFLWLENANILFSDYIEHCPCKFRFKYTTEVMW